MSPLDSSALDYQAFLTIILRSFCRGSALVVLMSVQTELRQRILYTIGHRPAAWCVCTQLAVPTNRDAPPCRRSSVASRRRCRPVDPRSCMSHVIFSFHAANRRVTHAGARGRRRGLRRNARLSRLRLPWQHARTAPGAARVAPSLRRGVTARATQAAQIKWRNPVSRAAQTPYLGLGFCSTLRCVALSRLSATTRAQHAHLDVEPRHARRTPPQWR